MLNYLYITTATTTTSLRILYPFFSSSLPTSLSHYGRRKMKPLHSRKVACISVYSLHIWLAGRGDTVGVLHCQQWRPYHGTHPPPPMIHISISVLNYDKHIKIIYNYYRAVRFYKQRGGNASNTCTVLSHLGTKCEYLGVLPDSSSPEHRYVIKIFLKTKVIKVKFLLQKAWKEKIRPKIKIIHLTIIFVVCWAFGTPRNPVISFVGSIFQVLYCLKTCWMSAKSSVFHIKVCICHGKALKCINMWNCRLLITWMEMMLIERLMAIQPK